MEEVIAGIWLGHKFTKQWLVLTAANALVWRCETCNCLIKPHDLDLIRHVETTHVRRIG